MNPSAEIVNYIALLQLGGINNMACYYAYNVIVLNCKIHGPWGGS